MSDKERRIGKKLVSVKNMGQQDDNDPLVAVTTIHGYECWLSRVDSPWGVRGYLGTVVIPEGHPWYGRSVEDFVEEGYYIHRAEIVDDGITGHSGWGVGFTTANEKTPNFMRTREYAADKLGMLAQQAHDVAVEEKHEDGNPRVPPPENQHTIDKKLAEIRDGMPPKLPTEKHRTILDLEIDEFRLCLVSVVPFGTNTTSYIVMLYGTPDEGGVMAAVNTQGMPAVYEFNTYLAAKLAFEALASLRKVGEAE